MRGQDIIDHLNTLSVADLRRVHREATKLLALLEERQDPEYNRQEPQEPSIHYQQEYTKCGKPSCKKCNGGQGHGPYWYAYWSEGGKTRSKYIGKYLPDKTDN